MESYAIKQGVGGISFLPIDFALARMSFADVELNHGMIDSARKDMEMARGFIEIEPYNPHNPELIEAWRQTVVRFNNRIGTYQEHGIQLKPIYNPYTKPYREHLRDDLEKILSVLPAE